MKAKGHLYRNEYLKYQAELKQKGICFLANEKSKVVLAGNSFVVNGLELPLEYYHKPFSPKLTSEKMEELMGMSDRILVLREGKISGSFDKSEEPFTQESIMKYASIE